jgi:hypothetical protein
MRGVPKDLRGFGPDGQGSAGPPPMTTAESAGGYLRARQAPLDRLLQIPGADVRAEVRGFAFPDYTRVFLSMRERVS